MNVILDNIVREVNVNQKELLNLLGFGCININKWQFQTGFGHVETVTRGFLKNWLTRNDDQINAAKMIAPAVEKLGHKTLCEWLLKTCKELDDKEKVIRKLFKRLVETAGSDMDWETLAFTLGMYDLLMRDMEHSFPRSPEEYCFRVLICWYEHNQSLSLEDISNFLIEKVSPLLKDKVNIQKVPENTVQ